MKNKNTNNLSSTKGGSKDQGLKSRSPSAGVDSAIELLNWLVEHDHNLVQSFVTTRFPCNQAVWDHPTIQVGTHTAGREADVSMLGILNGVFGTVKGGKLDGYGFIAVVLDENGRVLKFKRTEEAANDLAKQIKR